MVKKISCRPKRHKTKLEVINNMKKLVIIFLVFFIACGPSEDEIQARIDKALEVQEYKHSREIEKAVEEAVFQATSTTVAPKDYRFNDAIEFCNIETTGFRPGVSITENGDSLFLDGSGDSGGERTLLTVDDIFCVLSQLNIPQTIISRMSNTNSLMGVLEDKYEDIKVSWSYSGNNGLDVYFKLED